MRRRFATLITVSAMAAGALVGLSAQPANALARCTTGTHRHWHAEHGLYHTWYWQYTTTNSAGRPVFVAYMPEHGQWDSAVC